MKEMNNMRKIYLDNLRWATVILILIYHVCYIFNGLGIFGGIPDADTIAAFDAAASIVYPWFMVFLFVVAGMSARYSLQKRTTKQFLKERVQKLLVPSTLGLFVIHWITGYMNIKMGGALSSIPSFLIYPISVLSGIGPLWFIQLLFIFSCIIVLLKKLDKSDKLWDICGRANIIIILLLFFVVWGASFILNAPILTTYRFGIYFASFAIGYFILSHDEIQEQIEKIGIPALIAAFILAIFYTKTFYGTNFTEPACLQNWLTNIYLWITVIALLGFGKKFLNHKNNITEYLAKNSFGLYILHYPVLTVTCYILHYHTELASIWKYLFAIIIEFAATIIVNEIMKHIPFIRFLVLGYKKN